MKMNYFIPLITVLLLGIAENTSDKKIVSIIRGIYSEALPGDTIAVDSYSNDTVTYTGIFNPIGDSVSISMSTSENVDVFIRSVSKKQYTTYFYWNNQFVDSLKVRCENGSVFVNKDRYVLSSESYDKFIEMRSVLTLSHLLIDCLGDYPRDILKLLNLNWDVDYYECRPEKAVTVVQSPHSDMKYKFEAAYIYDIHNNFTEIVQRDRYTRKVIRNDENQTKYLITYNYGDRLSGQYIQTIDKFGNETLEGDYTQVPSQQEFHYKQVYQAPKKYITAKKTEDIQCRWNME